MQDLYACALSFDDEPARAYEAVLTRVAGWIGKTYGDPDHLLGLTGQWQPEPNVEIRWETLVPPDGRSSRWTCSWRRPLTDDGEVHLTTKCRVQRTKEQASAWFRQVAHSTVRAVRPVEFRWTRPPVVRTLIQEQRVMADGRQLRDEPQIIHAQEVETALLPLLLDPSRTLPVVVVTTPMDDNDPLVDDSKIAGLVGGIAHVVRLRDKAATFAMTDALGKPRAVYDGAVRLYWPGFSREADLDRHPLFQRREIQELRRIHGSVAEHLLQVIGAAAALHRAETWLDPDYDLADARARKRQRRELRTSFRDRGVPDDVLRLIDDFEDANDEFAVENERLRSELENTRNQVAMLEEEVERKHLELRRRSQAARAGGPASVYEAVRVAAEDTRRLRFLPEALDSAWDSQYQQPERVYDALIAMDEIAQGWAAGSLPDGIAKAFAERGLDLAGDISESAQEMFRDDYLREYDGRQILLGPHVRFGHGPPSKMLRIYFYRDDTRRMFVIGHVGSHLRGHRDR